MLRYSLLLVLLYLSSWFRLCMASWRHRFRAIFLERNQNQQTVVRHYETLVSSAELQ